MAYSILKEITLNKESGRTLFMNNINGIDDVLKFVD